MSLSQKGNPKRRKVTADDSDKFKPGYILKLRVRNFTTYSYGEFKLSPTLNMIIGPNGTGKSTFVAAVCLGLGGKVDLIKRKTMDSMIKSGENESSIEITLKNKEGSPNVVVERRFFLKQNKSKWTVNGEESDIIHVRQIVKSLNIQLDNLCHFLPQERVAEFASLSLEKLLLETERTVGDGSLIENHQLLIELDDKWVELSKFLVNLTTRIADLTADVEKFEQEAQKYQEYEEKTKQIDHHKKLLPYAKLQDVKEQMKSLKKVRDHAKIALQEFSANTRPLEVLKQDAERDIQLQSQEVANIKNTIYKFSSECKKSSEAVVNIEQSLESLKNKIESLQTRTEKQKTELRNAIDEKEELSTKLFGMENVDEDKLAHLSSERQDLHNEKLKVDEEYDSAKFETNSLKREIDSNEKRFREERKKLENNDRLEILNNKSTRYRRELMENAYKSHILLRKEKKQHGLKYYEAPIVSCHVTHQKYAKYIEKVVDNNSLFALFFDNEQQYRQVSDLVPREFNVPMRVIAKGSIEHPMPVEKIKALGFDGYLSDFIKGPEAVIRGLNHRSYLHSIPVALKPIDPEVIKKLLHPTGGGHLPFMKFIVENSIFMVGRSRYGSKQVFYQTEHIGEAQLMASEGLTEDIKKDIQLRLHDLKSKIEEMRSSAASLDQKKTQHQDNLLKIDDNLKGLETELRNLRKKKEAKVKLEDTIKHIESRIALLTRSTSQDYTEKIKEAEAELMGRYVEYAQLMNQVADLNDRIVASTVEFKKAELRVQQEENKLFTVKSLIRELDGRKGELQERYKEAKDKYDEYKKGDAAKEIRQQTLSKEDRDVVRKLAEEYLAQEKLSEKYLLHKIEQLEDDMTVLSNVDRGSIDLLKSKRTDLELAERQLPEVTRRKDDLKGRILKISVPWESELSSTVEQMSKAFQKNFVTVASDGQVELVKLERFKDWKLEILVKFRENSELKVLDHQSQSGGERAVSTIFFLMSLQGLTNAPIRIVDEINQGMDPKNEKMAHKYLVRTACKKGASQYFLVTPKLLTGLYYHPDMAIHCIFTGPLLKGNDEQSTKPDFLDLQRSQYILA